MKTKALILLSAILLLQSFPVVQTAERSDVGVVLIHGFGLTQVAPRIPQPFLRIEPLAVSLRKEGFTVVMPEMPWSPNRIMDATYNDAMKEIDAAVEKLKAEGTKHIVVGGHSLGANAALRYGATRSGLAGLIGLAPAWHPPTANNFPAIKKDVDRSREMVTAGKGDKKDLFTGNNCCPLFSATFWATPRIYLSYYDPDGDALMPRNAAAVKAPVLWILGKHDGLFQVSGSHGIDYESFVYEKLPPNPFNRKVIIAADHAGTPEKAASDVLTWLKSLPQ